MLISSSLQSFTGGPGQDVSCELNKGILAHYLGSRVPRDEPLCITQAYRQHPFSD